MENHYYREIMNLYGMDGLKNIIRKWHTLSESSGKNGNMLLSTIPNMLWVIDSGAGNTHILSLISEYLHAQRNVIEFAGNRKFIEFICEYCPDTGYFNEINRLHETIRLSAGRRSKFKGILCVDISKWVNRENEEHFQILLDYLANECSDNLIVLVLSRSGDADTAGIERVISSFLRIEKAVLELPDTDTLMNYVKKYLKQHNLTIKEREQNIISQSIETLRAGNCFSGYKTLNKLCADIIYETLTLSGKRKAIPNSIASRFSGDSEYIKSMIYKSRKEYAIGFIREGCYER